MEEVIKFAIYCAVMWYVVRPYMILPFVALCADGGRLRFNTRYDHEREMLKIYYVISFLPFFGGSYYELEGEEAHILSARS